MTEAELLELAAMSRANTSFLATQIIAIQFALIAGIFLFLNRAGFLLKVGILILYTAGYIGLLTLYYWEQTAYASIRESIQSLPEISMASAWVVEWAEGPSKRIVPYIKGLFISNWFVVAFFLFAPVFKNRDE